MEHRAPRRSRNRSFRIGVACLGLAVVASVGLVAGVPFPTAPPTPDAARAPQGDPGGEGRGVGPGGETRAGLLGTGGSRVRDAEVLLDRQIAAVQAGDRAGYRATLDPAPVSDTFLRTSLRTYDNLVRMGVAELEFDDLVHDDGALTPERRRLLGESAFVASTLMRVRLTGADRSDTWTARLRLVFVERGGDLYLAGDREGAASIEPVPLWLLAEVEVVDGDRSRVIGTGGRARLEEYTETADSAVDRVSDVWGSEWDEHVVVVVPSTREQMEQVIGAEQGTQEAVAAVTTSVGRGEPNRRSHIVVNPIAFTEVGELGRLVVLSHETTHVATSATVSRMPMWLSEGFADYVAFKDTGLPVRTIAGEALDAVRGSRSPVELPADEEFDPLGHTLDRAYETAWLACRYIVERWDEATLVELYRQLEGAGSEEYASELEDVLEVDHEGFVADWRTHVEGLAGPDRASDGG